jgi:hypothetical protein
MSTVSARFWSSSFREVARSAAQLSPIASMTLERLGDVELALLEAACVPNSMVYIEDARVRSTGAVGSLLLP